MSEWHKCPNTTQAYPLMARPGMLGVLVTHGTKEGTHPDPTGVRWDLSVAELRWLLKLAEGGG